MVIVVKGEDENVVAELKQCSALYVGALSLQGEKWRCAHIFVSERTQNTRVCCGS